jgi:hypothetical protein
MRYWLVVFLDGWVMRSYTREAAVNIQQSFEYGLGETCWITRGTYR